MGGVERGIRKMKEKILKKAFQKIWGERGVDYKQAKKKPRISHYSDQTIIDNRA